MKKALLIIVLLMLTSVTAGGSGANVIFEDDFSGTSIDWSKWELFDTHTCTPHGTVTQDNELIITLPSNNNNCGHMGLTSKMDFSSYTDNISYEVDFRTTSLHNWQDQPLRFHTPIGGFIYANYQTRWIALWRQANGQNTNVAFAIEPMTEQVYRLRVEVDNGVLRFWRAVGGGGYQLVHSVAQGEFTLSDDGRVWLIQSDRGPTYYDDIIVTSEFEPISLAWWPIEEGSGDTLYDASGNGHYGVIHGANWVPGYCNGYALEFDGVDDYVSCGVIQPYLTTSFTVEVVFKVNSTGGNGNWFFSTGGWDPYAWTAVKFYIRPSGELNCGIRRTGSGYGVDVTSPGTVDDGDWHHAALVYDNTNLKLYLDHDPTPVAEAPATGTIVRQNNGTFIGRYDWWTWEQTVFSGIIDEVRIRSTALSPDQFLECEPISVEICDAFLTPKRVNVHRGPLAKPNPGHSWKHDFKIHIIPCEPMDVSVGDSADVFVDVDASGSFDEDENYLAIVSSTDVDGEALDIAIKVYVGEDLIDNDPCVAIYSINHIPIVDTLANQIDYLCLDTFDPSGGGNSGAPVSLTLRNHPNPFNPATSIQFSVVGELPSVPTSLKIYNIRGQLVRTLVDEPKATGTYEVIWDGKDETGAEVASGVYFYKFKAGEYTESQKMILMK